MSASRAIGLYAVAVILLGALFAPWLFWGVQQMSGQPPAPGSFATYPFHRIFDRSVMIIAFAGLWPLLRAIGIRSWSDLGYAGTRGWAQHVVGGWALGIVSFVSIVAILVAMGSRSVHLDRPAGQFAAAAFHFLLAGIAIALIEETLFRGALQGALQRGMPAVFAVVVSSVVYSALHFLKPNSVNIPTNQVEWYSGFSCLVGVVSQSYAQRDILVAFVSLFLAGCVLGLAYSRTGALYLPIGLHAGWVLANESARWLGARGTTEHIVAWPMLGLLLLVVARLCRTTFKPLCAPVPSGSGRAAPST